MSATGKSSLELNNFGKHDILIDKWTTGLDYLNSLMFDKSSLVSDFLDINNQSGFCFGEKIGIFPDYEDRYEKLCLLCFSLPLLVFTLGLILLLIEEEAGV